MRSVPEILTEYSNLLWELFKFDLDILSVWWMWAPLCIPAVGYLIYMYFKWWILLLPLTSFVKLIRMIFQKTPSHPLPTEEIKEKCENVWQAISNDKGDNKNN